MVKKFSKILIVIIVSLIISCFSYADDEKAHRINDFVEQLNHGAGATMNDIIFGCSNCESNTPILDVKMTTQCLKCEECYQKINNFLGQSFTLISEVWFKHFGTRRINIYNNVGELSFIITEDGELIRPMPLLRDYT